MTDAQLDALAAADPATVQALVAEVRVFRVYMGTVQAWLERKQEESEDD